MRADDVARALPEPLAVDIPTAARLLGISPFTVRAHTKKGLIPSLKIGARRVIPFAALRSLVSGAAVKQEGTHDG